MWIDVTLTHTHTHTQTALRMKKKSYFFIHTKCQLIALFHDICMLELLKIFPWNIFFFTIIINVITFSCFFVVVLDSRKWYSFEIFHFVCNEIPAAAAAIQNKRHPINFNVICKSCVFSFHILYGKVGMIIGCLDYRVICHCFAHVSVRVDRVRGTEKESRKMLNTLTHSNSL